MTKASENLFTTQPAVSRSIRRLEAQVGHPLFVRTARGVVLTTEGKILYKYSQRIFQSLAAADKEIRSVHSLLEGEIRIGISATLCKHYLMDYLNLFNQEYPGIVIRVTNPTTPEIIQLMKSEQIDIGIVNLPIIDNDLVSKELLQLEDCFVVGTRYKELAAQDPLLLSELGKYPLLMLEKRSNTRKHVDRYFQEHGIRFEPEFELGNLDLLAQFAINGLGVACLIKNFVQKELEEGLLFQLPMKETIPPRFIRVSYLKDLPLSPAAAKFLDLLER